MMAILGVSELILLMPHQRLAELIMIQAHESNHDGPDGTLAKSRSLAWIHKARNLARRVDKPLHLLPQEEGLDGQTTDGTIACGQGEVWDSAFRAGVCLDLMGPVLVRGMVNKRASQKVWPLLFVCQATGALHICLMHELWDRSFPTPVPILCEHLGKTQQNHVGQR